jgi:hypothetical protein
MQEYSDKKQNITNFLITLIKKIKPKTLKNQPRPAELPPTAPDCGWNHGEVKDNKV